MTETPIQSGRTGLHGWFGRAELSLFRRFPPLHHHLCGLIPCV